MIRTSRKWKNAVRFQAVQAFRPEWKRYEKEYVGTMAAQSTSTLVPTQQPVTSGIVQGIAENQRIGDVIRVHRVDAWISIRPEAGIVVAPELPWRWELVREFSSKTPIGSVLTADYIDLSQFEWARGVCPRELKANQEPRYDVMWMRKGILAGIGAWTKDPDPTSYTTVPSDLAVSGTTSTTAVHGSENCAVPIHAYIDNEPPPGPYTETLIAGYNIVNGGKLVNSGPVPTHQMRRHDWKKSFHVVKKFPGAGLRVKYDATTTEYTENQLVLQGAGGLFTGLLLHYYIVYRVWFTDA